MQGGKWLKAVGNVRRILQMTGAPPPKTPLLHSRGLSHIEGRDLYRDRRGWTNVCLQVVTFFAFIFKSLRLSQQRADNFLFVAGLLEGRNWKWCVWVQQIANQTIKCASRQERGGECAEVWLILSELGRVRVFQKGVCKTKSEFKNLVASSRNVETGAARRRECLRFPDD